jgi:hypothetical protein
MLLIRRAGILLMICVLALALGAGVAAAKKKQKKKKPKSWDSSVTLTRPGDTQFAGNVGSKLSACRGNRVVTLYYTDSVTSQVLPLSVQRTDSKGNFQMNLTRPAFPGGYQVIVEEQTVKAMKAKQTCRGATSAFLAV